MNTDSIGKQKKLFAIIMAIVLLLLCMIPALFTGVAYADGGNGNSGSGSSENGGNDSSDPAELYYFSDYANNDYFRQELHSAVGSIEYYYWEPEVFQETFRTNYKNGDYSGIRDTHIIFEMRKTLEPEVLSSNSFVYVLRDFFKEMQDNGCFIMLIFGTEGSRLRGVDEFLDYVDIHVNTDKLYTFVSNIFDDVAEDCGGELIKDCTFLINKKFAFDSDDDFDWIPKDEEWYQSEFFRNYFLVYFKSVYRYEIEVLGIKLVDLFDLYDIKVLYEISSSTYIDVYKLERDGDPYVEIGDHTSFYSEYMDGQHVYAIGKALDDHFYFEDPSYDYSYYGDSYYDWFNELTELQKDSFYFPIYVYNTEAHYWVGRDVYQSGHIDEEEISCMAADFLQNQNLSIYDNWSGRCIVTHKMIKFGPDGWMVDLEKDGVGSGLLDNAKNGWQIYMSEEDYSYFFSEDNIF